MLPMTILLVASAPGLAQAPAPVSKATFIQRIDRDFSAADANKDGFVDRSELEAQQAKTMAARKASNLRQREAAFRQLDSNKDGSLTLQEFNSVAAAQQLPKADVTQTLSRFDTNKDGRVSRAENQAPAVARFDRSDSNKDGTLSVEEQQRARPKQ